MNTKLQNVINIFGDAKIVGVRYMGLRATIQGNIEGFPVVVYLTEEDINARNEDGDFASPLNKDAIEIGLFQAVISDMRSHGMQPAYRQSTGATATTTPSTWECPVHGASQVRDGKFGIQCNAWEPVTGAPPEWANNKVATVAGQPRYYCKHRPSK